jgi:7,8-dihydroneopterin aldolase/epimerase/oxygenase
MTPAVVELAGLEVPGLHGVEDRERESLQPFLYDLWLELAEPAADRIEDTVDYRAAVALVREVSESRQFHLLETMAAAVAEALMERFPIERARVRVRKPQVQLGAPAEFSAATVERARG